MKYITKSGTEKKEKTVLFRDKGLNLKDTKSQIADNELSLSKNIILKDGALKTRNGLRAVLGTKIDTDEYGQIEMPFTVTDVYYEHEGEKKRIAYDVVGDSNTYQTLRVYLISDSLNIIKIGELQINRASSEQFLKIKSLFFTVARGQKSGIFLFLHRKSEDNPSLTDFLRIYEYDFETEAFVEVNEENAYVPIVLLNGRGTRFAEALKQNAAYDAEPKFPEDINLLFGKFKAYFSSDGYSSVFKLPIAPLKTDSYVYCRVYANGSDYSQWTVLPGESSAVASYKGQDITFFCNRSSGYVRFSSSTGDYAVPRVFDVQGNNIIVTAFKADEGTREAVLGCTATVSSGNSLCLYGNEDTKNEIFGMTTDKYLYFPESMNVKIGLDSEKINRVIKKSESFMIFKENNVYTLPIKKRSEISRLYTPLERSEAFSKYEKYDSPVLFSETGSFNKNTFNVYGNTAVFLSKTKSIYKADKTLSEISEKISPLLESYSDEELKDAFLILSKDENAFFINNTAIAFIKLKNGEYAFYELSFPEDMNITSAFLSGCGISLVIKDSDGMFSYVAVFDGESDILLTEDGERYADIPFEISLKKEDFTLPFNKKILEKVSLSLGGKGIFTVTVSSDKKISVQHINLKNFDRAVAEILPFLESDINFNVSLSGKAPFWLCSVKYDYKVLG